MQTSILSESQEVPVCGNRNLLTSAPESACHTSHLGGLATTWCDKMPEAHYTALPARSHTAPRSAFSPRSPASLSGECIPNPSSGGCYGEDLRGLCCFFDSPRQQVFIQLFCNVCSSSFNTTLRDTQDERVEN